MSEPTMEEVFTQAVADTNKGTTAETGPDTDDTTVAAPATSTETAAAASAAEPPPQETPLPTGDAGDEDGEDILDGDGKFDWAKLEAKPWFSSLSPEAQKAFKLSLRGHHKAFSDRTSQKIREADIARRVAEARLEGYQSQQRAIPQEGEGQEPRHEAAPLSPVLEDVRQFPEYKQLSEEGYSDEAIASIAGLQRRIAAKAQQDATRAEQAAAQVMADAKATWKIDAEHPIPLDAAETAMGEVYDSSPMIQAEFTRLQHTGASAGDMIHFLYRETIMRRPALLKAVAPPPPKPTPAPAPGKAGAKPVTAGSAPPPPGNTGPTSEDAIAMAFAKGCEMAN